MVITAWILYRNFCGDNAHLLPQHPPISQPNIQTSTHLVDRNTVLGDVARLAAVVTSLGKLVSGKVTVLRNVSALTARVTLNGTSLAVLGEMVGATALVAHGTLGATKLTTSSWRRRCWSSSTFVLWAVSGDVTKFGAVVALGALGAVRAVALDVTNVTTQVTLLRSSRLWLRARRRLVTRLTTVVAQSFSLLAVVGDVAGLSALVTRSWEHFG